MKRLADGIRKPGKTTPNRHSQCGLAGKRCRAGVVGLLFLMSIAGLSGCQISWPFDRPAPLLDSTQFMDAWKTYLHCQSSTEPDEIRADLHRLNRAAHTVTIQNQASVLLPAAIRSLIAAPPSRLAVDPKAMVVACALHGGHVAQSAGQAELSVELFTTVVAAQKGAAYAYYAVEASRRLKRMEIGDSYRIGVD